MIRNIAAGLTIIVLIYAIICSLYEHFNLIKTISIEHKEILKSFSIVEKKLVIQQGEINCLQKLAGNCYVNKN